MLIQPFVENAIWHGLHPKQNGIGKISINMHQQDDILHCSICDNGVGIDNSKTNNSDRKKIFRYAINTTKIAACWQRAN